MKSFLKREYIKSRQVVGILLILFFIFCVATATYCGDTLLLGEFEKFDNDDVKYLRSADTLLKSGRFTYENPDESSVFIMPGIVIILLPFVKVFGLVNAVFPFQIFSAFLQTITVYVFFKIAEEHFDRITAFFTLILMIFYIPLIYISNLILTETCFLFCFAWLLYFSLKALKEKEERYYIFSGVMWGLATLFRPMIVLFPVIIFIIWICEKYSFRDIKKYVLMLIIPFLCLLLPWWVRNVSTFKTFIPLTLSMGNPMLQGAFINNEVDFELIEKLNVNGLQYSKSALWNNYVETEFAKLVSDYYWKNDFWRYFKWNFLDKIYLNLTQPYCSSSFLGLTYSQIRKQHLLYVSLGILGLCKHEKRRFDLFLQLTIFYLLISSITVLSYSRYMIPVIPIIIIFASNFCCEFLCKGVFLKKVRNVINE